MSTSTRHKRPELERSEPIRNWSGVFGVAPAPRSAPPAPAPEPVAPQTASDPISRGVELGYRVIDQYLQQGQAFARAVTPSRGSVASAASAASDPQRFTEQLARSTFDLAATFIDFVSAANGGGLQGRPAGGARPAGRSGARVEPVGAFEIERLGRSQAQERASAARPPEPPAPSDRAPAAGVGEAERAAAELRALELERPLVTVDVSSRARAEVTLELKPGSAALQLSAHELRAVDPALPRISQIALECCAADNRVTVRLHVPDDQPQATYTGLVIDEATHLPRGSLTVRVVARTA